MSRDDLEIRCKKAILSIADNVKDINHKLTHFLENYRDDYYGYYSAMTVPYKK